MRRIMMVACVAVLAAALVLPAFGATRGANENWWFDYQDLVGRTGVASWLGSNVYAAGMIKVLAKDYTGISTPDDPTGIAANWQGTKWAFCIDRPNLMDTDWYSRQVGGVPTPNIPDLTLDPDKWKKKVWLINSYWQDAWGNKDKSAGLQLAIWEVLTDDAADLTAGDFKYVSGFGSALGYANTYLTGVQLAPDSLVARDVYYVDGQNLNEVPVPEWPVAALAPFGLGLIGMIRRKLRQ